MSWDNTPIIDSVQLPGSDTKYLIADAEARTKIDALVSATHFIGVSSTEITDGGNESPTIGGIIATPAAGDIVIYKPLTGAALEFIWDPSGNQAHPNGCWQLLGGESVDNLGDLAYKDSASGSYTPEGSVELSVSNIELAYNGGEQGDTVITDITISDDSSLTESVRLFVQSATVNTLTTSNTISGPIFMLSESTGIVDLVTSVNSMNTGVIIDYDDDGYMPTISNTSTITASISGTTLVFGMSDIGFTSGSFSTFYDGYVNGIIDCSTIYAYLIDISNSTQTVNGGYIDLYYGTTNPYINSLLSFSSVAIPTSATFSGSAATITVS